MYAPYVLHEHYDALDKDFHLNYLKLQENLKDKVVHEMRRNIKQQIAFTKMLRALDEHFPIKKVQAPFHRLFKKLGKLRDLAIERKLLKKEETHLKLDKDYDKKIKTILADCKEEVENCNELSSLVAFRQSSKKIRESIDRIPIDNTKEHLVEYFYFLISTTKEILQMVAPDTDEIHRLRQLLNILYYNLKLVDRMIPQATLKEDYYDLLVRINSQMGEWHDEHFTLCQIGQQVSGVEKKLLNNLTQKEKRDCLAIQSNFDALTSLLEDIEKDVYQIFAKDEPLHIPEPNFKNKKYKEIKKSISQMNIGDSFI